MDTSETDVTSSVSETDVTSSVCGYLVSMKYDQYLEIEFDRERKKIDTK